MVERDRIDGSGEPDFRIGEWLVRPELGLLERGGRSVHLEARTMAVLVCLARHAPNLVTKERLLGEVWAGTPFVSEDVISHAVWELRRALGDAARSPTFIETLARKGYRLRVPVGPPGEAPQTSRPAPGPSWQRRGVDSGFRRNDAMGAGGGIAVGPPGSNTHLERGQEDDLRRLRPTKSRAPATATTTSFRRKPESRVGGGRGMAPIGHPPSAAAPPAHARASVATARRGFRLSPE